MNKEQKQKLIGKWIYSIKYLVKEYKHLPSQKHNIGWYSDTKRCIVVKKRKLAEKLLIIGFTHLCEGTITGFGDTSFTCTKKIPVIKVATGITGKIEYVPIQDHIDDLHY